MTLKDEKRFLKLSFGHLILNKEEYRVATFEDETESKSLQQVKQENRILTMLHATVNHEMVTPLQCIVSFAKSLDKELIHSDKRKNAQLISLTASLVLS